MTEIVETRNSQHHILVINDAQEILDLFKDLLEEAGYQVSLYSYSIHDLEQIKAINPDLVILDLLMGGEQTGWQMLEKIRLDPETAKLPVIVCTAAVEMVRELQGHLTEKNVAIVLKPFDIDDILRQIDTSVAALSAET
ncbi:MAG TPA: response regulator [Thermomicrobiales bacterium]|nr:response regulator [Thermomicrobiales bacterium]